MIEAFWTMLRNDMIEFVETIMRIKDTVPPEQMVSMCIGGLVCFLVLDFFLSH